MLHQEDAARNVMPVYDEEKSHTNKWLYVVIALLLAAFAFGGYYLFESNKKNMVKEGQKEPLTDSSAISDETESNEPITPPSSIFQ